MLGEAHQQTHDENGRRHGRVLIESVQCSLGDVIDLSRSGMRVITRRAFNPEQHVVLTAVIEAFEERLEVPTRCVWCRRAGLFRHEIGFEFGELDEEQAAVLCRIARTASNNARLRARGDRHAG